ncbi:DUF397 domain-containing protein [Streptomyces griseofuscus]|uniref:DUF397 domain-containing protein n=1 Tax=Streptomyces griseofuscus TaxID=146922 RepID=UPI0033C26AFE
MTVIPNSSSAGYDWTKSSFSGGSNNCVETALDALPAALPVRDSKVPAGPAVVFGGDAWTGFLGAVKSGDLA